VELSIAVDGVNFSRQTINLIYLPLPIVTEITPIEGVPNSTITIKGSGFFPCPSLKVKFVFTARDNVVVPATCIEDPATTSDDVSTSTSTSITTSDSISLSLPSAPVKLPAQISGLELSFDGLNFVPGPSGLKFTFLDPNKVKKK
jgi:hypothetical protein